MDGRGRPEHRRCVRWRARRRARRRRRPGAARPAREQQERRRARPCDLGRRRHDRARQRGRGRPGRRCRAARHGVRQRVRLRINSGVHASTHEYLATAREDQKFGVPIADAPAVVAAIRSQPELEFVGLHSHIGSQIFESGRVRGGRKAPLRPPRRTARERPGSRAEPRRRVRHRLHRRGPPADRSPIWPRSFADVVAGAAAEAGGCPDAAHRDRAGPLGDRAVDDHALHRRHREGRARRRHRHPPLPLGGRRDERQHPALALRRRLLGAAGRAGHPTPSRCWCGSPASTASRATSSCTPTTCPATPARATCVGVPATGAYGWAMASNYNYLGPSAGGRRARRRRPAHRARRDRGRSVAHGTWESSR